jgi:hypothetical protein
MKEAGIVKARYERMYRFLVAAKSREKRARTDDGEVNWC